MSEGPIAIVIEGEAYDDPRTTAHAFASIVQRLMKELPDTSGTHRRLSEGFPVATVLGRYDRGA